MTDFEIFLTARLPKQQTMTMREYITNLQVCLYEFVSASICACGEGKCPHCWGGELLEIAPKLPIPEESL